MKSYKSNRHPIRTSFVLMLVLVSGCRFFYEEKPLPGDSLRKPIDTSKLSYALVQEKVFNPRCISCHGSSGGVNLENLENIRKHLIAINRTALIEKSMPKNGRLTVEEADILDAWIKAGAPGNPKPEPTPEPLEPLFISIKKHIIEKRCIGCHSEGGAAKQVPLGTLKEILDSPREIVIPGNPEESGLMIAVERTDAKRMPPPETGDPLTTDEINILRKWIENGAPEK